MSEENSCKCCDKT